MKITLKDFCMIKEAEIELNGITVITGDNDSGKSTVGKALFCLFNTFYNVDKMRLLDKLNQISTIFNKTFPIEMFFDPDDYDYLDDEDAKRINNFIQLNIFEISHEPSHIKHDHDKIIDAIQELVNESLLNDSLKSDFISDLLKIKGLPIESFLSLTFDHFSSANFKNQINNIKSISKESLAKVEIKAEILEALITENKAQVKGPHSLNTRSIYIDDPRAIDRLSFKSPFRSPFKKVSTYLIDAHLQNLLKMRKTTSPTGEALMHDYLKNILDLLNTVVPGTIQEEQNDYIYVQQDNVKLYASNLSTGLKVFAIIKILLLNESLEKNGTIILDEPEIHLHPDWQLKLAEVIVLLQRDLNLHILLTTHSPYFLEAIRVYAKKYKISEKCKYYLTRKEENGIVFDDKTDSTLPLFEKFGVALENLEQIENEIERELQNQTEEKY